MAAGRAENFENAIEVRMKLFMGMACPAVWTVGGSGSGGSGGKDGDGDEQEKRKTLESGMDGGAGERKCEMGSYSVYVVKALSTEDVKAGVEFANQYGLRLVVKNTGHDFLVCISLPFSFPLRNGEVRLGFKVSQFSIDCDNILVRIRKFNLPETSLINLELESIIPTLASHDRALH